MTVHKRADHRDFKTAGERRADGRYLRQARKSKATFYKYEVTFGGMEVSDARKLKALEDENAKLKTLLAKTHADNDILKDVASKKW